MQARFIQLNGIVQGVGFRPFVARLARELRLCGWVKNSASGVQVHVQTQDEKAGALDEFARRLKSDAPAAAQIISLDVSQAQPSSSLDDFQIVASQHDGSRSTLVSPDLATCPDCLKELFNPQDRRFHYPFINCTNCGPRFTIIEDLPYDRPVTSMGSFEMCETCAAEYGDENDRRYHAQPDACFDCGPHLWFKLTGSDSIEHAHNVQESDELIAKTARLLEEGQILALKSLGGWHLVCDATNQQAVDKLRQRKNRPDKPLAIAVRNLDAARALCLCNETEAALLESAAHPIVLLQNNSDSLARNVAGDLPEIGIMLASTPVQHLLLHAIDKPLVMTSANRSGEPIVAADEDAFETLSAIADFFLGNNRAIVARYDDSVVRVLDDGSAQFVRRARGYAPAPLFVDEAAECPAIFAAGPEQKATFCMLKGNRAYISQHLGDLEHLGAWDAWQEARERYSMLFDLKPQALACDMHPEYLSTKWAKERAARQQLPLVEVQHHHAHIASVLGENGLHEPVLGVAIDGTGFGTDGTIWGCELLVSTRSSFERFWHLPTFALPGGSAAIHEPWRCGFSLKHEFGPGSFTPISTLSPAEQRLFEFVVSLPDIQSVGTHLNTSLMSQMIVRGINSPRCSSLGRLFDGISALLGICTNASYDGQAAAELEAAARRAGTCAGDESVPLAASRAHHHVIDVIIEQCELARKATGISKVALSGGCMVNRILSHQLKQRLEDSGFSVYTNRMLPPNDGCIAYGQAIVAQARLMEE